jgi:hypothetical protein
MAVLLAIGISNPRYECHKTKDNAHGADDGKINKRHI